VPGQVGSPGLPGIPGLDGCNGTDVCIIFVLHFKKNIFNYLLM
jgi:hypothetical protein